jgi:hypothetical protein
LRLADEETHAATASDQALSDSQALPIYGWLERSVPEPTAPPDWPRSLVKTKDEDRRGETSQA